MRRGYYLRLYARHPIITEAPFPIHIWDPIVLLQ